MRNIDIRPTQSNDGDKFVVTIDNYEMLECESKNLRDRLMLRITVNRLKRVVTVIYIRNFLKVRRPAEILVANIEELSSSDRPVYKHVAMLINEVSNGKINSSILIEDLIKSSR